MMKMITNKLISCFIAICFILSFVFADFVFAETDKKLNHIEKSDINSIITDSGYYNNDILVIHILDLHSNPDAQKEIVKIMAFYDSKKSIEKIFAEGAPLGRVSLELFSGIGANIKKDILDKMLEKGQIGACEYYALTNKRDILYGIEDKELYDTNLNLIQRMLALAKEKEYFLNSLSIRSKSLKRKYLAKAFFEVDAAIDEENQNSYSKIISFLKNDKAFYKDNYKEFLTFLSLKEYQEQANLKNAAKEVQPLNDYMKSKFAYGDYTHINKLLSDVGNKAAMAKAYEIIIKNDFDIENKFPAVIAGLKINHISENLNIFEIYSQKELLKKYIRENYASDKEKEVLALTDIIDAVQQIYALNITRQGLSDFIENRKNIRYLTKKYMEIGESNTLTALAENKVTDLIYANNLQRDQIFFNSFKNTIGVMPAKPSAGAAFGDETVQNFAKVYIVVTGGFHTDFIGFLKDNKISYINIMPKTGKAADRKHYFDAFNVSTIKHFVLPEDSGKDAFAPPLVSAIKSLNDDGVKSSIVRNLVTAWVNSAAEQGITEKDIYFDIAQWLVKSNISIEEIKKIESISFLAAYVDEDDEFTKNYDEAALFLEWQEQQATQKNSESPLVVDDIPENKSIYKRIKDKLGLTSQHWSFPDIAAGAGFFKSAISYSDFTQKIKTASRKKVKGMEFAVKSNEGGLYIKCSDGFTISLDEALNITDEFLRHKKNIILDLTSLPRQNLEKVLCSSIIKRKNEVTLVSKDKEFLKSIDSKHYKNVNRVYSLPENVDELMLLDEIKEISSSGIFNISTKKETFSILGAYLLGKFNGKYLNIYINESGEERQYSDFIFEGKSKTLLLSSDLKDSFAQRKTSLTAYRNVAATPFIQLVIGFEFFASFSTIFLNGQGYDLGFLSSMFAICGPLNIIGSMISSYLGKVFGKRNVLVVNLLLHCAGDALLLVSGISPVFLGVALGVPAIAAAGISTLLVPFLHSSLSAIGQDNKFESVYGKTRSIFWIGLAVSSIIGSWLAQAVSQGFVIALSSAIITSFSIYSIFKTGTLKKTENKEEQSGEEKELSNFKEGKKIFSALKTVFTTKDLSSTVIINFVVDSGLFALLALGIQPMLIASGLSMSWLGILAFAVNIIQSISSKFANKVSSLINNAFKRTVYFGTLAALVSWFFIFNSPAALIIFYVLANFWQGASSVIEPAKVEESLSDDVSSYWFSVKTVINSALTAGVQLLLASALAVFQVESILVAAVAGIAVLSGFLGFVFQNKSVKKKNLYKNPSSEIKNIRRVLAAA